MFSASTPSIGKRSAASSRSRGCPRGGEDGRSNTCKKPGAARRRPPLPDAPRCRRHRGRGQQRLENANNVELIFGEGRFTAPKVVEVTLKAGGTRTLTADTIFINTGGRPARPDIAGIDSVEALDSTSIMEMQALPEHLLVL